MPVEIHLNQNVLFQYSFHRSQEYQERSKWVVSRLLAKPYISNRCRTGFER